MRFERARTRLLLGKLQRRRRGKEVAANTLAEALAEFEDAGAPVWANQVRTELARTSFDGSERFADLGVLSPDGVVSIPPHAIVTIARTR